MLFSSLVFIWFFLPATVLLYTLARGRSIKNAVLLIASLFFYGWGEPHYILLVIITIFISYFTGIALLAYKGDKRRKQVIVFLCIVIDLGILGYYKYFNFLADTMNGLIRHEFLPLRDIVLPLGISFYTFQAISYVVDTYRGKNPAQKNLFHLAVYICLFPQILSGPIVKYHDIAPQITDRKESLSMQAYGIKRFTYGLAKKVLLANSFGQTVDRILTVPAEQLGTVSAWLMLLLYSLQIYYDFSGYSDMAIGLGRIFGFTYAENFNYPYLSASVSEFWRRWHISLSTWFRDYLYIPLGGNRKGLKRTCLNLLIVFFATGLWHGASATFIFWGIYFGIFIVLERLCLNRLLEKNPIKILNHAYALLVVGLGWLLFRTSTLDTAFTLFKVMLHPSRGMWNARIFANNRILFLTAFGILFCGPVQMLLPRLRAQLYEEETVYLIDIAIMVILLFLSTMVMISGTYNAFIYFKF